MRSLLKQTAKDRAGGIDGLNLFFGALLGANLGTLDGVELLDYVQLILVLAATVMALRMLSVSERRRMILTWLGFYCLFLIAMLFVPGLQPDGLAADDLNRLVATVAIWVGTAVMIELWPVHDYEAAPPPEEGEEAQA